MATTSAPSNTAAQVKTLTNTTSDLTSSAKLEDQAATAALYVTHPDRNTTVTTAVYITHPEDDKTSDGNRYIDSDNKLSSAGAAASLKYAKPKDLPSFPSAGIKNDSAAGAAASLGWANQKPFEHWKPDPSSSASKAAMLAKDYKSPTIWQPEQSTSGAKAALLAAKEGGKVEIWRPEASSYGNSAATQAFKTGRTGNLSPKLDYGYTELGRQRSLMAATGAMSGVRKRSESTPVKPKTYPDEADASAWALSAATRANKPLKSPQTSNFTSEAGAVPVIHMPREMFTSHPPVAPETEEKNRDDVLKASAIAMAKRMYIVQQKQIDDAAKDAANSAAHRRRSTSTSSDEEAPMRLNNLQEAAQRLAQERLAKLHDEHAQNREYLDYYGRTTPRTSRLSIRGRNRQRASSEGSLDDDKNQSEKIRAQMSLFSSNLSQIDEKKRQKDREALMAIAAKNVAKSLQGMDERVYADTGKASPAMMNEWEVKAHAAAQRSSETRMENYGKVNIGGGKFIDQSAVDEIAARNVQPILDEINEKAEQARVRAAELQLEQDAQKRAAEAEKTREREIKEINRKLKEQDKEAARARKEEEKATKAEQKRAAKEEKRKSREGQKAQKAATAEAEQERENAEEAQEEGETVIVVVENREEAETAGEEQRDEDMTAPVAEDTTQTEEAKPVEEEDKADEEPKAAGYVAPVGLRTSMERQQQERLDYISDVKDDPNPVAPGSPGSPGSSKGVKGWFKNKFGRRMSRSQKGSQDLSNDKQFVGGAALTGSSITSNAPEETPARESIAAPSTSIAAPSTAEETTTIEPEDDDEEREGRSKRRPSSINKEEEDEPENDLEQHDSKDDEFEEARDHFNEDLAPPPSFAAPKPASPVRDSKFHEVI